MPTQFDHTINSRPTDDTTRKALRDLLQLLARQVVAQLKRQQDMVRPARDDSDHSETTHDG